MAIARLLQRVLASFFALLVPGAGAAQVTFTPLEIGPFLGLGAAEAVSHDGSTVVGTVLLFDPELGLSMDAVLWMDGQPVSLGVPQLSSATGISGDGSVIVGLSDGLHFRLEGGSLETFGTPLMGQPFGISSDGTTMVGSISPGGAYRRRNGVIELLTDLDGATVFGLGHAASADGSIVVGYAKVGSMTRPAFWDAAGAGSELPMLPGHTEGFATAVTADGAVMVGRSWHYAGPGQLLSEAIRWESATATGLGVLGGDYSIARAISADGSIVVGSTTPSLDDPPVAFIWDEDNGMRSLQDLLEQLGADLTDWTLDLAVAISGDGRSILGYADNVAGYRAGFVATVPVGQGAGSDDNLWAEPLPEPTPDLLLAAGVIALITLDLRRRRQAAAPRRVLLTQARRQRH